MNEEEKLPLEERENLLELFKELSGKSPDIFMGKRYRLIKRFLLSAVDKDLLQRDIFGLNPVVVSLQTALLAEEEIGIKGEALTACLLLPAVNSEEELDKAHRLFGDQVFAILHGLRRIIELYDRNASIRSENFRNLLVSLAEDMRVILIMIASRVTQMRLIRDTEAEEAKQKISEESAYLYAPLAHKLGLYKLKSELEDLSLKYMEHDAYYHIKDKLNATKAARDAYIEQFIQPIREMLDKAHLKYHIKGRTKSIHSIWQKMKKQQCKFEGVYDLFAIRIILDSKPEREKQECWQVYSLITDRYMPNPKRLRDWLSIPKSNGYESLHITVLGPEQKWVEVQIRTERMDEVAEHGLAAHWRYKGVKSNEGGVEEWLANIRAALETGDDLQLMDQFKTELKEDEVYVFSPKGDLFKLGKGATVLDFAYHIHSNVGNACIGARINGRNVSMRHALSSGDQVSILTSSQQKPKQEWLSIVKTGRAKSKIRQALKDLEVKDSIFGKELLDRKFKNRKIEFDEAIINHLVKKLGFKESSEFFSKLATGELDVNETIDTYQQLLRRELNQAERTPVRSASDFNLTAAEPTKTKGDEDALVIDQSLKGIDYTLAKCCHPVYGDDIFGFVTVNGGIKIHRTNCPNATALRERCGYRIVRARWAGKGSSSSYPIVLHVIGNDNLGVVNNITSIIGKESDITLRSISIEAQDSLFSGILTVNVNNSTAIDALIKKLRTVKGVKNVSRE